MASINCPTCNHRIQLPTRFDVCPNCGALLDNAETNTGLVTISPTKKLSVLAATPVEADDTPTIRQSAMLGLMRRTSALGVTPWQKMRHLGFFSMPRPDLEASILAMSTQQETVESSGLLLLPFVMISNFIFSLFGQNTSDVSLSKTEKISVLVMRVKTNTDEQYDVRLRGQLAGSNLSVGDNLVIWGKLDEGILIADRLFNLTTRAVVKTSGEVKSSPISTLLVLLLLGAVMLWALGLLPIPFLDRPEWFPRVSG